MRINPDDPKYRSNGDRDYGCLKCGKGTMKLGFEMMGQDFDPAGETYEERMVDTMCGRWKRPYPGCE